MPLADRDYYRGDHPPSCTCADCCAKRLERLQKGAHPSLVSICPQCGKKSLWHNTKEKKYECLNPGCRATGSSPEEIAKDPPISSQNNGVQINPQPATGGNGTGKNNRSKTTKSHFPKWLRALVLIFFLSLIGLIINIFIGNLVPFYLLLGFSIIYSVQKWFYYETRKSKLLGIPYRLILNLSILSLFGLLVWSGIKLFSQQFMQNLIVGSLVFLAEFVLFVWLWRVVAKNSWRRPSMKLTIFSMIIIILVLTFAGVQPMALYKDNVFSAVASSCANSNTAAEYDSNITTTTAASATTTTAGTSITTTSRTNSGIDTDTGTYKNYKLGLVKDPIGVIAGSGCYDDTGGFIILINNSDATNPTFNELLSFIKKDNTDQYPYRYVYSVLDSYYGSAESHVDTENIKNIIDGTIQPTAPYKCGDFAERLHNNAEKAGIRCGYVSIELSGYDDPYNYGISSNAGHALNIFETTDRGLVYIDCTGGSQDDGPSSYDTKVNLQEGRDYIPQSLFPEAGWNSIWPSMGTVDSIFITWDGDWNA